MCKRSLKDEENGVKKNRREVSKWVRKEGLKFEVARTHTHYILRCLGLLLETKTKLKFRQSHQTVRRFVRTTFFGTFPFVFTCAVVPLPSSRPSYPDCNPSTPLPVP